jgi:hypothetical protein
MEDIINQIVSEVETVEVIEPLLIEDRNPDTWPVVEEPVNCRIWDGRQGLLYPDGSIRNNKGHFMARGKGSAVIIDAQRSLELAKLKAEDKRKAYENALINAVDSTLDKELGKKKADVVRELGLGPLEALQHIATVMIGRVLGNKGTLSDQLKVFNAVATGAGLGKDEKLEIKDSKGATIKGSLPEILTIIEKIEVKKG